MFVAKTLCYYAYYIAYTYGRYRSELNIICTRSVGLCEWAFWFRKWDWHTVSLKAIYMILETGKQNPLSIKKGGVSKLLHLRLTRCNIKLAFLTRLQLRCGKIFLCLCYNTVILCVFLRVQSWLWEHIWKIETPIVNLCFWLNIEFPFYS